MIDESSERSIRQQLSVQKWVDNGCKGTLELTTGFGKTRCAVIAITRFLSKNSGKILILVPTAVLKKQWIDIIKANNFPSNIEVMIFNTAARRNLAVDFLILDEVHLVAASTLLKVFQTVRYQMILGLTATFERLDGREILINKSAPVVDTITPEEARQKVMDGKASPILYFMELKRMDWEILSNYVGIWKIFVKRHAKPTVFSKLKESTLKKYAEAFEISVDELKNFDGNHN